MSEIQSSDSLSLYYFGLRIHEAKTVVRKRPNCPHHSHYPENPFATALTPFGLKLRKAFSGFDNKIEVFLSFSATYSAITTNKELFGSRETS